jgi:hypothetical protein
MSSQYSHVDELKDRVAELERQLQVSSHAVRSVKEYFDALEDMRRSGDDGTDGGADFELYMRTKLEHALKAAGVEIDLTWPHT